MIQVWRWVYALDLVGRHSLNCSALISSQAEREPRYDPATVIDVQGFRQDVRVNTNSGSLRGLYLVLKTESDTIDVYLGPTDSFEGLKSVSERGEQCAVSWLQGKGRRHMAGAGP